MGIGGKVSYSGHAVDDWRASRKQKPPKGGRVEDPHHNRTFRCVYCGAIFPEDKDNCPKCGAGA